jgi:hypothetical protein
MNRSGSPAWPPGASARISPSVRERSNRGGAMARDTSIRAALVGHNPAWPDIAVGRINAKSIAAWVMRAYRPLNCDETPRKKEQSSCPSRQF